MPDIFDSILLLCVIKTSMQNTQTHLNQYYIIINIINIINIIMLKIIIFFVYILYV